MRVCRRLPAWPDQGNQPTRGKKAIKNPVNREFTGFFGLLGAA
ncbi:hypothetical protein X961_3830 [Burkholderia pseudomallei MSHR5613]|nr:hypothetical protein X961_3830 [Burkholderia pseudomallei MSHR5613]